LSSILYRKEYKENMILIFSYILLIFLFFMTMGVFYLSPTKHLYKWLYENIPYFSVFRDAYKPMFLIHFMYAILIGFTLKYFYTHKYKLFLWIAGLVLVSIAIISFQFWSGSFLRKEIIVIPQYWNDFARYMVPKRDKITLTLPNMSFTGYDFTAIKGKNTGFFRPIFDNNVIFEQGGTVYDDSLIRTLYKSAVNRPQCFQNLAGLTGISYILNQYDLYVQLYDSWITPSREEASLNKMSNVQFEKQFGKLKFYALNNQLVYDSIYIPERVVVENTQDYCHMAEESFGKNSIAFVNKLVTVDKDVSHPSVSFHNYNEAMYSVHIANMQHNELLVLNKRFDGGWKVFEISNQEKVSPQLILSLLLRQPLRAQHIGVNGFANGWYIHKTTTERDLILVYVPQLYLYTGLLITFISGLGLMSAYLIILVKKL